MKPFKPPPPEIAQIEPVKGRRNHLLQALQYVELHGDWAEFGTYQGRSARILLTRLPANTSLHLFDSFEGLPEAWDSSHPKGRFALNPDEIPTFDDPRVKIHKGWFEDTVPKFAKENRYKPLAVVSIDSDLYSSAVTVLEGLNAMIVPGTLLIFDELFGFVHWERHEWKAFREWAKRHGREYKYLTRAFRHQVSLRVLE